MNTLNYIKALLILCLAAPALFFILLFIAMSIPREEHPLAAYMPVSQSNLNYIEVKVMTIPKYKSIKNGESFYLLDKDGLEMKVQSNSGKHINIRGMCPLGKCTKQFVKSNQGEVFLIGYMNPDHGNFYYIFDMTRLEKSSQTKVFDINEANKLFCERSPFYCKKKSK